MGKTLGPDELRDPFGRPLVRVAFYSDPQFRHKEALQAMRVRQRLAHPKLSRVHRRQVQRPAQARTVPREVSCHMLKACGRGSIWHLFFNTSRGVVVKMPPSQVCRMALVEDAGLGEGIGVRQSVFARRRPGGVRYIYRIIIFKWC